MHKHHISAFEPLSAGQNRKSATLPAIASICQYLLLSDVQNLAFFVFMYF